MKNIIILLLCCFSLSICAQNSVKTPKKSKWFAKAKKVTPPILIKEYQFIAPKSVVAEPDTPFLKINLKTGDASIYKGDTLVYIFKKYCDFGCFQIIPQRPDTLSSEKFASSAFLIEAKYRGLVFDKDMYSDFKKANLETEPEVLRLRKVIDDAQKGIDRVKYEARKVKQ